MRLIDADALQDAFYDECEGECYYCDYHLTEGIQEGRLYECGLINKAPTIAPIISEWISVKDKLPEKDTDVLIYTTDNKINKAYRRHKSWTENQKEWLVFETLGYGYIYDDDEVLAWMPLPTPYEEGGSDDVQ